MKALPKGVSRSRAWLLLIGVLLAGCGNAPTVKTTVSPAATATTAGIQAPPIQTVALGNFMANYVTPSAHGLLLLGTPGTVGQAAGPVGYAALYYYDDASQQVAPVARPTPAADGTARGIQYVVAAGDWAAYVVADSDNSNWELWALNLTTESRRLVDSAAKEGILFGFASPVLDGVNLAWSALSLSDGQRQSKLQVYSLATGAARTLLTVPAAEGVFAKAMFDGTLCLIRGDGSTWLWTLTDPSPRRISAESGLTVTMNNQYVVWDDVHSRSLTLYDRGMGTLTDEWDNPCIRPAIFADRPYVVCVDFDANTYRLAQLPSGQDTSFFDHASVNNDIGVSGNRAYWVGPAKGGPYSNQIDYFELPSS